MGRDDREAIRVGFESFGFTDITSPPGFAFGSASLPMKGRENAFAPAPAIG